MAILLYILAVPVGLIVLLLILALFTKKNYTIVREVLVKKPAKETFHYAKMLRNQEQWSVWVMQDPKLNRDYTGTDGTVGFKVHWKSDVKSVGEGIQTITAIQDNTVAGIQDNTFVKHKVQFISPFAGEAEATMKVDTVTPDTSKVTWILSSGMKYPMNIMLALMNIEKQLGNDMVKGLHNFKSNVEA